MTPLDRFRRLQQRLIDASQFSCEAIRFDESREWSFEDGILRHRTGRFFGIGGLMTAARRAELNGREQVIILQPHRGINGLLMQRRDGIAALLLQGRIEPGNIGIAQMALTVQATEANYLRLHGGAATPFLDWFARPTAGRVLFDTLQSEEGSRFHGKYNRNIAHEVPAEADLALPEAFAWYGIDDIRHFAACSNVLNTDARSVLACLDWRLLANDGQPFAGHAPGTFGAALRDSFVAADESSPRSSAEILQWLAHLRAECAAQHRVVPIESLRYWVIEADQIHDPLHRDGFSVRQFAVTAIGREVPRWDQPLVESRRPGLIGLVCQQREGTLQFLLRASYEIGFVEGVQLSTALCTAAGDTVREDDAVVADILRRLDDRDGVTVHAECDQSEEGGRFYRDENHYCVIELDRGVALPASDDFRWATLGQLRQLITVPGALAIELRGALTILLSLL